MQWSYLDFIQSIFKLTTIDLSSYKERQMKRRIDALIARSEYKNYHAYFKALVANKELRDEFMSYITINVSEFYRNPKQWEALEKDILPNLLQKHDELKIWSAACSTGEEPYSLAMLLSRFIPLNQIKIIATDIDASILQKAKEGSYIEKNLQNLPKELIVKYFHKQGAEYYIDDSIKTCVDFRQHDLLKDEYPKNCHLIVCRNVLIYFTEEAKSKIYNKFYKSLHPEGILFVGSTEQIILPQRYNFVPVQSFFYKKAYEI
ncbi:CheR family methyltransferase [Xylanivirga thermophila]|jgi:chemotaxis protein methyltransferase CheR|uniref:CheR family methyltransferase n=1 Tax=Xylanivirga thermophila TaxID=2496273 RepID=UPI00101E14C0|nr:protein-glutamate O-methyltransferase CheR [Xylanivirga thermophila]